MRVHWASVQFSQIFSGNTDERWTAISADSAARLVVQHFSAQPTNWPFHDNFGFGKASCHMTIRWSQLPYLFITSIVFYYTVQVNLGGDIEYVQLEHLLTWKHRFKCRYSPNCPGWSSQLGTPSASSIHTLWIISIKDSVSFERWYYPNHRDWGLSQLQVSDPLIASLPNAINRKGRAPCQLQALIFSDIW